MALRVSGGSGNHRAKQNCGSGQLAITPDLGVYRGFQSACHTFTERVSHFGAPPSPLPFSAMGTDTHGLADPRSDGTAAVVAPSERCKHNQVLLRGGFAYSSPDDMASTSSSRALQKT